MPEEFDALLRKFDDRRVFLDQSTKALRSAKTESGWDPIMLLKALEVATASPLLPQELKSVVGDANAKAEEAYTAALLVLEADIKTLCQKRAWKVDGQWPSLIVERAVDLKIHVKEHAISVAGRKLSGMNNAAIAEALEERVAGLLPKGFDPKRFIVLLAKAYDAASNQNGGETPIVDVYRALVITSQSDRFWRDARHGSFTELGVDQFRARLSAALESGNTTAPDGRELRLLPPIDPKNAVFLYQPAEHRFGFVGRIQFVKPRGDK